jgi:IS30 family transposase
MKYYPEQIDYAISSVNICASNIYNWGYLKLVSFDINKLRRKGKRYKVKSLGKLLKSPDKFFFEKRIIY